MRIFNLMFCANFDDLMYYIITFHYCDNHMITDNKHYTNMHN